MSVPVASATHSKRCAALTADTWLPSLVINVQNLNLHIFDFCQILHIGFFEQLHSSLLRLCLLTWRTFHAHRKKDIINTSKGGAGRPSRRLRPFREGLVAPQLRASREFHAPADVSMSVD